MSATFAGAQLDLELMDPGGTPLVRLFRHPGGDWQEPPVAHRNQRVDPPPDRAGDYAVLYTAESVAAAAVECRILHCDGLDRYTYDVQRTMQYSVVRYQLRAPAIFIPIDRENKRTLGLRFPDPAYAQHRSVAHQLFERYGTVVHGLSWESYHRNQPGRVYALWHHHKDTLGLAVTPPTPYPRLAEDPEWLSVLRANPGFTALAA
jgi:hypothetical protein